MKTISIKHKNPAFVLATIAQAYSKNASVDQLIDHMVYLNNVLPDEKFIEIFDAASLSEYFINFPSDTQDKGLLTEYISLVEAFFVANDVDFKSLNHKLKIKFVY